MVPACRGFASISGVDRATRKRSIGWGVTAPRGLQICRRGGGGGSGRDRRRSSLVAPLLFEIDRRRQSPPPWHLPHPAAESHTVAGIPGLRLFLPPSPASGTPCAAATDERIRASAQRRSSELPQLPLFLLVKSAARCRPAPAWSHGCSTACGSGPDHPAEDVVCSLDAGRVAASHGRDGCRSVLWQVDVINERCLRVPGHTFQNAKKEKVWGCSWRVLGFSCRISSRFVVKFGLSNSLILDATDLDFLLLPEARQYLSCV